jgi:NAD(P)-dependent dehydrogenase (short-subunit alcohol dehydrogenase family)
MTSAVQEKGAVIVTGASRGSRAAIAERPAHDGYGVIVNYAADAEGAEAVVSAIDAKGGRAAVVRADVASEDDVEAMFDRAREQMGPLTALVSNAGSLGEQARIDEQAADELTRLMQVSVVGPMLCAKLAVRAMSTAHGGQGGCIVTMASGVAKAPAGLTGIVPYAATKGAMVTFARGLSNEVASEGIRVNSVSPGVIDTEMAYREARDAAAQSPLAASAGPRRSRGPYRGWSRRRRRTSPAAISRSQAGSERQAGSTGSKSTLAPPCCTPARAGHAAWPRGCRGGHQQHPWPG